MLSNPPTEPIDATPAAVPAFGHLSGIAKDTMYSLQPVGFVFASPWVCAPRTSRHAAALLLSTDGRPFTLQGDTERIEACAAFVPPLAWRSLEARDVGLVSINVTPGHAFYADLRRRGGSAMQALAAEPFAPLQAQLRQAYRGELGIAEAAALLEGGVAVLRDLLPGRRNAPSRQSTELLSMIVADPDLTLPEVAERSGLSYDRASHALRQALGLSLKSYQCWRKMNDASVALFTGMSMTEVAHAAGFADSAHLSRTFKQQLGLSPSYLRQESNVRLVC